MASAMAHRGPDGIGRWHDGFASLALCLLRLQTYAPHRPMPRSSSDGRYAIVLDGRIDNRAEIAARLNTSWVPEGDDALVLEAFLRWGHAVPELLCGEFSFAIWDARERALFCARDPVGARPFFFRHEQNRFLFASEDMAVAAGIGGRPEPYQACLASRLIRGFRHFNVADSDVAGIKKLMPGHWLRLRSDGQIEQRSYWNWDEYSEPSQLRDDEYAEALRELMLQAVQCRMPTLAPATLFMSGGIDSLAVFGAAKQLERQGTIEPLRVHSLVRDDPGCLETSNLRLATAGRESTTTFVDGNQPWRSDQEEEARHILLRHPTVADLSLADMHWLAQLARQQGVCAAFTGISGDMTAHCPTAPLAHQIHAHGLSKVWPECKALAEHHSLIRDQGRLRILMNGLWEAGVPIRIQQAVACHRAARHRHHALAMAGIERGTPLWDELDARVNDSLDGWVHALLTSPRAEHLFEIQRGAIQLGLEGFGAAMSLHGMEHLDPWSDVRLMRFCISLPLEQRTRDGWYKYLVRRAFEPWLPPVVWHREKKHLGNLIMRRIYPWLVAEGRAALASPPESLRSLVGSARARQLIRDAATDHPPAYLGNWTLSTIIWLRWLETC